MVATESQAWHARSVRVAVALLVLLLAACTTGPSTGTPSTSPSTPVSKRTQQFESVFVLQDQKIRAVGSAQEKTYGMAEYAARVDFLDNRFKAEMLVASDYVKGNGTFEGFVTLESRKGDIGLRITGITTAGDQGRGSSYSGETEIIGGTGEYDNLAGRGQFSGQRIGAPGTPVNVQVKLELIDPK
jgi:hypothetical protein